MTALPRPRDDEYAEYYRRYVALVPDGPVLETLRSQFEETRDLLAGVPAERETYRYAPDKWSIREVVGHLADSEWVFFYRAVSMARGDTSPLPGMDPDVWADHGGAHHRPLPELVEDWAAIRAAGVRVLSSLDAEAAARPGRASGMPFTARTFPWIVAGHELHHRAVLGEAYDVGS